MPWLVRAMIETIIKLNVLSDFFSTHENHSEGTAGSSRQFATISTAEDTLFGNTVATMKAGPSYKEHGAPTLRTNKTEEYRRWKWLISRSVPQQTYPKTFKRPVSLWIAWKRELRVMPSHDNWVDSPFSLGGIKHRQGVETILNFNGVWQQNVPSTKPWGTWAEVRKAYK